ncbi:MAG: GTPase HflX [Clostridia bacterium]|nr:GTPase HflX [Clostridia bacterium]
MKTQVNGNTEGVKDAMLARLDSLYGYELEDGAYLPRELMKLLAECSCAMNREIAIYLTRDGEIVNVAIGTDCDVELTDYRLRRNAERLSRIRCVHTHPDGDGRLSDVDLSALKIFRYDAMTAVGVKNGEPTFVQTAFLGENDSILMDEPVRWYKVPDAEWMNRIELSDEVVGRESVQTVADDRERAVLMGIESRESLEELRRLAETAGAEVVGSFLQKRDKPDNALFIGKGRAEELARDCQALEADVCIFDEELTGVQARNLEEVLRIKVIDRTMLILDIFAQRATSAEGKLQVELAQLQYRSARLIGQGTVLSRLAGGIGTRGPGESKLEMSRRRIRERMTELRRRLDELERQRAIRRQRRERNEIPVVALVGYTNAGKSTLLNALTGADVYVQDQLFATLDAVSRRMETAEKTPYLLTDTVGFIRKLPHTLVDAFRSTLEEAALADVLVIVSDGSSPEMGQQHDTVEQVLEELGATEQKRIEVINKCDIADPPPSFPGAILLSAKTGQGLDDLKDAIAEAIQETYVPVTFMIPFSRYGILSEIHAAGRVISETHTDEGTEITVMISGEDAGRLARKYGSEIIKETGKEVGG